MGGPIQRDLLTAAFAAPRAPAPKQADLLAPSGYSRAAFYGCRVQPNGYAARPGTGPADETCGSCGHCVFRQTRPSRQRYYKCELMKARWTKGRGSDVAFRSPACSRWVSAPAGRPEKWRG